jgi:hypothetical protein
LIQSELKSLALQSSGKKHKRSGAKPVEDEDGDEYEDDPPIGCHL